MGLFLYCVEGSCGIHCVLLEKGGGRRESGFCFFVVELLGLRTTLRTGSSVLASQMGLCWWMAPVSSKAAPGCLEAFPCQLGGL